LAVASRRLKTAPALAPPLPQVVAPFIDCHVFRRREGREEWLVLRRSPHVRIPDCWQMVSGEVEPGEKAYEAALRELREETGLEPVRFYQASHVNSFYLAARDEIILTPVFAAEVAADAQVRLSEEHTEHEWVAWEEAVRRYPWPGQRNALRTIREQFLEGPGRPESSLDGMGQP
jgi:dihydroneopterin triphosphate diphosphatase